MSESTIADFLILYGSQTGNSECIAKELYSKCQENDLSSVCMTLNDSKKLAIKEIYKALIVICSTTGNGDAPENAEAWWRATKMRSLPKDAFEGVKYTVLALGDTNYDKFCHMGKSIDKRLEEVGGIRFFQLTCVDEATGLEESVERWKGQILDKLVDVKNSSQSESESASS